MRWWAWAEVEGDKAGSHKHIWGVSQKEGLVQRPLVRVCLTRSGLKDRRSQRSQESNPSRPKGSLKGLLWYGMKWNRRIWAEESHALTYIVCSSSCPVGNRLKVAGIATWWPKESSIMTSERGWWLGQGGRCGGGKKRWDFGYRLQVEQDFLVETMWVWMKIGVKNGSASLRLSGSGPGSWRLLLFHQARVFSQLLASNPVSRSQPGPGNPHPVATSFPLSKPLLWHRLSSFPQSFTLSSKNLF